MTQLRISPSAEATSWAAYERLYPAMLRDHLSILLPPLQALISSYAKPLDPTEVLLRATFADFLAPGVQQEAARETARVWGRAIHSMDYSRVLMSIDTGLLPFMSYAEDGEVNIFRQRTVSFLGSPDSKAFGYIHCDIRVFPLLASMAHRRYFPHVTELVNPYGNCHGLACGAAGAVGARTTSEVQKLRREGKNKVRADIDERVCVRDGLQGRDHGSINLMQATATQENPFYRVELNLQPVHELGAGKKVDNTRAPFIKILRYCGKNLPEVIVANDIQALPADFVERPLAEAPKSAKIFQD